MPSGSYAPALKVRAGEFFSACEPFRIFLQYGEWKTWPLTESSSFGFFLVKPSQIEANREMLGTSNAISQRGRSLYRVDSSPLLFSLESGAHSISNTVFLLLLTSHLKSRQTE